jgi:hypothetical protein
LQYFALIAIVAMFVILRKEKRSMPAQSRAKEKATASPAMIAVAVVILIAFIGLMAYHSLGPTAHPVIPDNVQTPIARWIRAKAQESGGDINKLSPEDQRQLQGVTQGKGVAYLKKYAHPSTQ